MTPSAREPHPILDVPIEEHAGRVLDWRPQYDEASRNYPMAAGRNQLQELPATGVLWRPGRNVLDQGREGACCGFGAAAELMAEPVPVPRIGNGYALGLYRMAQRRDQWPGENYSGTSVLATVQELRSRGLCTGYRWAFTPEQLLAGIVADGPAIIGVEWRAGAYSTDENAVLRSSGDVVGGHCLCLLGAIPRGVELSAEAWATLEDLGLAAGVQVLLDGEDEDAVAIGVNSWGLDFGARGMFVVGMSTLRAWRDAGWEAAQLSGRQLPGTRRSEGETDVADEEEDGSQPATADEAEQEQEQEDGTRTLEIPASELQVGDRLHLPDDVSTAFDRESATVRGLQLTRGVAPTVRVSTRSGSFPLGAGVLVKVRRSV